MYNQSSCNINLSTFKTIKGFIVNCPDLVVVELQRSDTRHPWANLVNLYSQDQELPSKKRGPSSSILLLFRLSVSSLSIPNNQICSNSNFLFLTFFRESFARKLGAKFGYDDVPQIQYEVFWDLTKDLPAKVFSSMYLILLKERSSWLRFFSWSKASLGTSFNEFRATFNRRRSLGKLWWGRRM